MRRLPLAALLLAGACATRTRPYRFASPMLGGADVPPPALPGPPEPHEELAHRGLAPSATAGVTVFAPPLASAAAADAIARTGVVYSRLPAPHRIPSDEPLAAPRVPADLRALVGRRTKRDPFELAIGWASALGAHVPVPAAITDRPDPPPRSSVAGRAIARAAATAQAAAAAGLAGAQLLAWAREANALHDLDEPPQPGDLLVFDEIESAADADLIALVIARDPRGVTEFIYASGGVIRRGFVDANRPALRRDHQGVVVNTFMRTGRRWPPKGTHYFAGELLSHVIRPR